MRFVKAEMSGSGMIGIFLNDSGSQLTGRRNLTRDDICQSRCTLFTGRGDIQNRPDSRVICNPGEVNRTDGIDHQHDIIKGRSDRFNQLFFTIQQLIVALIMAVTFLTASTSAENQQRGIGCLDSLVHDFSGNRQFFFRGGIGAEPFIDSAGRDQITEFGKDFTALTVFFLGVKLSAVEGFERRNQAESDLFEGINQHRCVFSGRCTGAGTADMESDLSFTEDSEDHTGFERQESIVFKENHTFSSDFPCESDAGSA